MPEGEAPFRPSCVRPSSSFPYYILLVTGRHLHMRHFEVPQRKKPKAGVEMADRMVSRLGFTNNTSNQNTDRICASSGAQDRGAEEQTR